VNKNSRAEGAKYPVYQSRLPLSNATVALVADLIRGRMKAIGSRWRKLPAGRIAVIVLAVLRHDQRLSDMAGGNAVSASTVRRWVLEAIVLLAARAPRLDRALAAITRSGGEVVLIDGTLVRTGAAPGNRTGATTPASTRPTGCCSWRSPTSTGTCCGSRRPSPAAPRT
jgi:hypothetical protein